MVAVDARRGRRSGVVRPPRRVTARRGRRPAALRARRTAAAAARGDPPARAPRREGDFDFFSRGEEETSRFFSRDPELEFDREAYPAGLVLGREGLAPTVVVATQRVLRGEVRGSRFDPPRFEPALEARRALPCVLRFALRAGDVESAAAAARGARASPHFAHALEWLLFTALEASVAAERRRREGGLLGGERGSPSEPGVVALGGRTELGVALELVSLFPERADVVASVARKSDAATWPALFAEAGDPAALQAAALTRGRLRVAACYLVVVDALLGAERGAEAGAALLRAALDARRYDVVGELARFLARKKSGAGRNGASSRTRVSDPGSAEPDGERRVGGGFFSFGEGGFLRWIIPSGEASARSVPPAAAAGTGSGTGTAAGTGTGTGTREDGSASWRGSRVASFRRRSSGARRARAAPAADADAGASRRWRARRRSTPPRF